MTNLTAGLLARHTPKGPTGRSAALIDIAQDLLLNRLADLGLFEHLVFKGGTALRKLYAGSSGRFSTDLDFSILRAEDDPASVTELLTEAIHGLVIDEFSYSIHLRRGRPIVAYETPFGGAEGLSTKLDIGPPPWLPVTRRGWVKLPVHAAYPTPATLPVMALVENMAEKVARLNRVCPARDVYDLVWVGGTTPHSTFDEPLLRRTAVLKCWVDLHGLHTPTASWLQIPGARPFDPSRWLHIRTAADFDDQNIGVLASPTPDLDALARALSLRFVFLADLDDEEARWAQGRPEDRHQVIAAIKDLPGGRLADAPLY